MTDILDTLEKMKKQGNEYFTTGKFQDALKYYTGALKFLFESLQAQKLTNPEVVLKIMQEIQIPCYMNSAQCYLSLNEWKGAIIQCDQALNMMKEGNFYDVNKYVKILYRKAKACVELNEFADASKILSEANKLTPNNQDVIVLMHENAKKSKAAQAEKTQTATKEESKFSDKYEKSVNSEKTEIPEKVEKVVGINSSYVNSFFEEKLNTELGSLFVAKSIGIDGNVYKALQDISAGESLLIDKASVFPEDYCYELLEAMEAKPELKSLFFALPPTKEIPQAPTQSKEFKRRLRGLREATNFANKMKKTSEIISDEEVKEFWKKVALNSFRPNKTDHLFPKISFIGHSAQPNCMLFVLGGYGLIKAVKAIPKDTPLSISYVDLLMEKSKREELLSVYDSKTIFDKASEEEFKKLNDAGDSSQEATLKSLRTDFDNLKLYQYTPEVSISKLTREVEEIHDKVIKIAPKQHPFVAILKAGLAFCYSIEREGEKCRDAVFALDKLAEHYPSQDLFHRVVYLAGKNDSDVIFDILRHFGFKSDERRMVVYRIRI